MENYLQKIRENKMPNPKIEGEIISYVASLKERVIKLKKEADNSEVILKSEFLGYAIAELPEISSGMQKPLFQDMTEELKKKLLKNYKRHLASLANHFRLVLFEVIIRPELWRKIESREKEFVSLLEGFEEIGPMFCQKKQMKN